MANPVSLILRKDPVIARNPVPARTPDIAVVYATADGQLDLLGPDTRDGRWQRMVSRYRTRYEIDLSDHRRTAQLTTSKLPTADGIYDFETVLDVGFRVYDPIQVIARNVTDPLAVVYGHLIDVCRPITRRFRIRDFADAENAVNQRFAIHSPGGGERLPEGILIYRCTARVTADPSTLHHLRTIDEAGRNTVINAQQQAAKVNAAHGDNEVARIVQAGELDRRGIERDDMARRPLDVEGLVRIHLERNPGDTLTALRLLQEYQQAQLTQGDLRQQRMTEMFQFLVDRNLVHAIDVDQFRNQAISGAQAPAIGGAPQPPHPAVITASPLPSSSPAPAAPRPVAPASGFGTAGDWDAPLPGAPSTSGPPPQTAAPATTAPTTGSAAPAHAVPVYLLVDTSAAVSGVVDEIDAGLGRLVDALAAEPDRTCGVHLSVIGVADTATTLHALGTVGPGTRLPGVQSGGTLHAAAAFDHVLDLVTREVPALKTHQPRVRRPQVIMFVAGRPVDDDAWPAAQQRLTDRRLHHFAAQVTVFGAGAATADTLARLAGAPDAAFAATTNDLGAAVSDFFAHLTAQMLAFARAALDGRPETVATVPPGFCVAASL